MTAGIQSTYSLEAEAGLVGDRADLSIVDIITKVAEDSAIGYGYAVVQGTADDQCKLPTATNQEFLGISQRKLDGVANSSDVAEYADEDSVNIVKFGRVWAVCEDGCSPGDSVFFRHTAGASENLGELRTDADGTDADQIAGATWRTTAAAGELGVVEIVGTTQTIVDPYPVDSKEDVTADAAAVSVLTKLSLIDSTVGAIGITLADGVEGQRKIIKMEVDNGDATLTPANLFDGTTITFDAVNESVELMFIGTAWMIISINGATLA